MCVTATPIKGAAQTLACATSKGGGRGLDREVRMHCLVFWMVDIGREGHSQRSAPQMRHTAHLRRCSRCTPGKPGGWDRGDGKTHPQRGGNCARQAPGRLSCSDLGRAQNAGPTESAPLWSTGEAELERLRPGKCMQTGARLRQFPAEQPGA